MAGETNNDGNNPDPQAALLLMLTEIRAELRGFGERIDRLEQPQPRGPNLSKDGNKQGGMFSVTTNETKRILVMTACSRQKKIFSLIH
ncbi:unnamed protein product [Arabis nemorensis]|uniref:Uncharacterized protein n=1 Tax=Arabis nemorensis TaxID=586526 RepID=A0A565CC70_9BRAS|nr:unnamed protein product [Arabis nemorensis]